MQEREEVHELGANPDSEYQDRSIKCVDCNESFIWTSGEQAFFHDKGLKNEPKISGNHCGPNIRRATARGGFCPVRTVWTTDHRPLLSFARPARLLSFVFSCWSHR
jgi:hypothetical protein